MSLTDADKQWIESVFRQPRDVRRQLKLPRNDN